MSKEQKRATLKRILVSGLQSLVAAGVLLPAGLGSPFTAAEASAATVVSAEKGTAAQPASTEGTVGIYLRYVQNYIQTYNETYVQVHH